MFTIAVIATFFLTGPPRNSQAEQTEILSAAITGPKLGVISTMHDSNLKYKLLDLIAQNAQTITLLWLLVIACKSCRLGFDLYKLHYIRTRQISPVDAFWEKSVSAGARQMEIQKVYKSMALQCSGNKVVYINALLSFREYQLNKPVFTLAFTGESGLLQRVKRIALQTNYTLRLPEKVILLLSVLSLFTFTFLFAGVQKEMKPILSNEKI